MTSNRTQSSTPPDRIFVRRPSSIVEIGFPVRERTPLFRSMRTSFHETSPGGTAAI